MKVEILFADEIAAVIPKKSHYRRNNCSGERRQSTACS